jgi:hypothetical protein
MLELSHLTARLDQCGFDVLTRDQVAQAVFAGVPVSSTLQTRLDAAGKGPADGSMFASWTVSAIVDALTFQTLAYRAAAHVAAQSGSSAQATARAAAFTALNALV